MDKLFKQNTALFAAAYLMCIAGSLATNDSSNSVDSDSVEGIHKYLSLIEEIGIILGALVACLCLCFVAAMSCHGASECGDEISRGRIPVIDSLKDTIKRREEGQRLFEKHKADTYRISCMRKYNEQQERERVEEFIQDLADDHYANKYGQ